MGLVDTCYSYMGYFCPGRVQGHFGVIQHTCLEIPCISKTAGQRAKLTEIWELDITSYAYIWGTFDLVWFKVLLGSFGALASKWPVSQKQLVIE